MNESGDLLKKAALLKRFSDAPSFVSYDFRPGFKNID